MVAEDVELNASTLRGIGHTTSEAAVNLGKDNREAHRLIVDAVADSMELEYAIRVERDALGDEYGTVLRNALVMTKSLLYARRKLAQHLSHEEEDMDGVLPDLSYVDGELTKVEQAALRVRGILNKLGR